MGIERQKTIEIELYRKSWRTSLEGEEEGEEVEEEEEVEGEGYSQKVQSHASILLRNHSIF